MSIGADVVFVYVFLSICIREWYIRKINKENVYASVGSWKFLGWSFFVSHPIVSHSHSHMTIYDMAGWFALWHTKVYAKHLSSQHVFHTKSVRLYKLVGRNGSEQMESGGIGKSIIRRYIVCVELSCFIPLAFIVISIVCHRQHLAATSASPIVVWSCVLLFVGNSRFSLLFSVFCSRHFFLHFLLAFFPLFAPKVFTALLEINKDAETVRYRIYCTLRTSNGCASLWIYAFYSVFWTHHQNFNIVFYAVYFHMRTGILFLSFHAGNVWIPFVFVAMQRCCVQTRA